MVTTTEHNLQFSGMAPHSMKISHLSIDSHDRSNVHDSHIHSECEIYFNITGDVSFMVEEKIYPIVPGSVIITKPNEYHHCIYHSNTMHEHYWILFSCTGNQKLFDLFFNRAPGDRNLIVLLPEKANLLAQIFDSLLSEDLPESKKYFYFFNMLDILENGAAGESAAMSQDVVDALKYISENFSETIVLRDIAAGLHVSVNTLERHFKSQTGITMREYLSQKRFANAARLLGESASVFEAYEKSGFSDYSHFISLFKKRFGVTPLTYQKRLHQLK